MLRTAREMLDAQFSVSRVTRILHTVRDHLRPGTSMSAICVFRQGRRIVFRDRASTWEPQTLQSTFNFGDEPSSRQTSARVERYAG